MRKPFFRDNTGGINELVATVFSILAIIMVVLAISAGLSAMNKMETLNKFADELVLQAANAGKCTGSAMDARYAELEEATGLSPIVTFSATYVDGTAKKVQYGDTIKLTLVVDTQMTAFEGVSIPIRLQAQKTALSQQYWK